jgi:hypothetical protein
MDEEDGEGEEKVVKWVEMIKVQASSGQEITIMKELIAPAGPAGMRDISSRLRARIFLYPSLMGVAASADRGECCRAEPHAGPEGLRVGRSFRVDGKRMKKEGGYNNGQCNQ